MAIKSSWYGHYTQNSCMYCRSDAQVRRGRRRPWRGATQETVRLRPLSWRIRVYEVRRGEAKAARSVTLICYFKFNMLMLAVESWDATLCRSTLLGVLKPSRIQRSNHLEHSRANQIRNFIHPNWLNTTDAIFWNSNWCWGEVQPGILSI